jgi:transcriptional regulator with XRE-family HTH domain
MNLSERIKREREKRGIKQVDMADALNIERSNYTRLENRGNKMTLDQIQAIANVIGISVNELMGIENNVAETKIEIKETSNDYQSVELNKRITELENIIKDKELIISFQEKKNASTLQVITVLIREFVTTKVGEYNLISVRKRGSSLTTDSLNDKKFNKNTVLDFLNKDIIGVNYEEHILESSLIEAIKRSFLDENGTTNLLYQFILLNIDELEEFNYWIEAYQSSQSYYEESRKKVEQALKRIRRQGRGR